MSVTATAGAVIGGVSAARSLFTNKNREDERQIRQQGKLMEQQVKGSKELADYEQALKLQMWKDTNYGGQLKQAQEAGVSKAAALGGSGTGTQGASVGGATGGQAASAAQTEGNNINQAMALAQIANLTTNTENE